MELDAKKVNVVLSYNNDQFKRTPYLAKPGVKIQWKRNGSRGSVNAKIVGYSEEKPDYVLIENWMPDWSTTIERHKNVWIKKNSILKVIDWILF